MKEVPIFEIAFIKTYTPLVHDPEVSFEYFCEGESLTQEHLFDQTDVNQIVEAFTRTGQLPAATRQGYYEDVSELNGDLTGLLETSRRVVGVMTSPAAESPPAESGEPTASGEVPSPAAAG